MGSCLLGDCLLKFYQCVYLYYVICFVYDIIEIEEICKVSTRLAVNRSYLKTNSLTIQPWIDRVGAVMLSDMAHITGVVAAGQIPGPFDHSVSLFTQ